MLIPESTSNCSRIWVSITSNNSSSPVECRGTSEKQFANRRYKFDYSGVRRSVDSRV